MDQENSQSWSVGCSDGRQKLECRGGRATTECGCQKWFGGSARYMKSECAFNFSRNRTTPESGPTFAKYPKRFLTLNFLGSGLALPILGYLAFYFAVPLSLYPKLAGTCN